MRIHPFHSRFMSADSAFRFRDAVAGDEAAIRSIVHSVLEEYGLKADPQRTDADLRDVQANYSERGGAFLVVISETDQIVGCGGLYPLERGDCEIRKMYLLPPARGRGVGGALVDHLLELARTKGFKRVIVETASVLREAIALYQKRGFLPFDHPHLASRCDRAYALPLDALK
jgi:GNAT superfamily N-acetyltransferase